jgi:hypothetical protein
MLSAIVLLENSAKLLFSPLPALSVSFCLFPHYMLDLCGMLLCILEVLLENETL